MSSLPSAKLPSALQPGGELSHRLTGMRPAVFLDYDGTLTPIVDRPEDARISPSMRDAVRRLAARCPVCVVSGRDRPVVQRLMGVHDLIVAGSHGFDIWSPDGGMVQRPEGPGERDLVEAVTAELKERFSGFEGASVEAKRSSVAVHYRLVAEARRQEVRQAVDSLLAAHPGRLRVTPGKMVLEIQPDVPWDKGRAVLHLLSTLGLDGDDVVPLYIGDDITDEDAFQALRSRGIGIIVAPWEGGPDGRVTAAGYALADVAAVEQFLNLLAGRISDGRVVPA